MRVANLKAKQTGATLILMAFIIALAATVYLLKTYDPAQLRLEQDKKTYLALNEAKQALIAWSVAHPNWPGVMPFPDRNGDGNYDGTSDCVSSGLILTHLLGKLPFQGEAPCITPQQGLPADLNDGTGERLWYAVSRNLIRTNGSATTPIINPSIVNNPLYQWLRVVDRNGVPISDRVAAVIIAPGNAIGSQSRPIPPAVPANPNMFLDAFSINGTQYSNADYDTENEDFVIGQDSRQVSDADTSVDKPYYFNDKLVYITVDELMAALEKRVGEQVRASLKSYKSIHGYYPYASELGTSLNFFGEDNLKSGFLPIFPRCSYVISNSITASLSCALPIFDVGFTSISKIEYYLPTGVFTSSVGSCSRQNGNTRCDCNGAGSCTSNLTFTFSCSASVCSAIDTDVASEKATGDFRIKGGKLTYSSGGCSTTAPLVKLANGCPDNNSNGMSCNTVNGTVTSHNNTDVDFVTALPSWLIVNQWQNYIFYEMTRPADSMLISVGIKKTEAAIVTTGASLGLQSRPSCDLNDYLELANVGQNHLYEPTSKLRVNNYNDQTFVIIP